MASKNITSSSNMVYKYVVIVLVIIVILLFANFKGFMQSTQQSATNSTTLVTVSVQSTSSVITTTITNAYQHNATSAVQNSSTQVIKEVLYSKKTIVIPAATYNPYYNYVIGCYWTDGAYNFSFNAPYVGYVVFNETNTGIPSNFTSFYFAAYISRQKPLYFKPQPYNDTSFCPGWTFLSQIDPWVAVSSYNNQTTIIPVKNGTNYVLFYNGNANQKHGVNPFPINVTFSMVYYGFNGVTIPSPPNTTTPIPNSIAWGRYP